MTVEMDNLEVYDSKKCFGIEVALFVFCQGKHDHKEDLHLMSNGHINPWALAIQI